MNKLNILNRVFSRNVFRHCLDEGYDETYTQVIRRYVEHSDHKTNGEMVSEIYKKLKKDYRNEYYYKNTILNKLLLGVHSVETTTALTEVAIAKSKADFVLINGKAVVYEIKTELDNLDRLENQIEDYYKVFDHVAVVTCESNIPMLKKRIGEMEKPVGIYALRKRETLSTIQAPGEYRESLELDALFRVLRKAEYEEILLKYFQKLPEVSEFKYYTECKKIFLELPLQTAYSEMLCQLKKRTKLIKEEFTKVPYELKFLAYFMNLKQKDYQKLTAFLGRPYGGV